MKIEIFRLPGDPWHPAYVAKADGDWLDGVYASAEDAAEAAAAGFPEEDQADENAPVPYTLTSEHATSPDQGSTHPGPGGPMVEVPQRDLMKVLDYSDPMPGLDFEAYARLRRALRALR